MSGPSEECQVPDDQMVPLPHKRGGQHIFTILRNFDLQFIENTSTQEFYGITIVKCPFMNKHKSRTLRRFVHRYGIIYGNKRNEFGNKICSRELAPATTTHFPLFVAPLSVILTKFYEQQKPSCLPRRHLIHSVVWLLDTRMVIITK